MQSISQAVEQHNSPGKIQDGREIVKSAAVPWSFYHLRAGQHFPIEVRDGDEAWARRVEQASGAR